MSEQRSFYDGGASPTGKRVMQIDSQTSAFFGGVLNQTGVEGKRRDSLLNQGIERILYPSMRLITSKVAKNPRGIPTAEASTILRDVKQELRHALTPEEVGELKGEPYAETQEELTIPTDLYGIARFGVEIYLDSVTGRYKLRLEPKNDAAEKLDAN